MSLKMIFEIMQKEHPDRSISIKSVEDEINKLSKVFDATPGLIGWDLLLFRMKQLLMLKCKIDIERLNVLDDLWSSLAKIIPHGYNLIYDPPRVYNLLLRYPDSFQKLMNSYLELRRADMPNFRDNFLDAFFQLRIHYRPNLTKGEVLTLLSCIEMQTLSSSSLAKKIATTKSYVSKMIASLRSKNAFYEAVRFAISALSLKDVIVLIEMDNLDAEIPSQFSLRNPWLHSLFDCKFGNRFILTNLIVPESWRSMAEIRAWKDEIIQNRRVTDVHIFQRYEKYNWMNFNYSSFTGTLWKVSPTTLGAQMKQLYEETPPKFKSYSLPILEGFKINFDDIKMIAYLDRKGPVPIRELRNEINRDYNFVRNRYNELNRRKIIRYHLYPSSLFAPESITIVAKIGDTEHSRLCNALSCAPEVYVQRTQLQYSVFTIRLPEGSTDYIAKTLNELLRGKERWLLQYSDQQFINWQFPIERWDSTTCEWRIFDSDFGGSGCE